MLCPSLLQGRGQCPLPLSPVKELGRVQDFVVISESSRHQDSPGLLELDKETGVIPPGDIHLGDARPHGLANVQLVTHWQGVGAGIVMATLSLKKIMLVITRGRKDLC